MLDAPDTMRQPDEPRRHVFRRRHRLTRDLEYRAVYDARARKVRGPLIVFGLPSERAESRLGLSVSRRVGGATVRNRIKRLLREAFRLERASRPPGYDLVINVRPHETLSLDEYRELLGSAWDSVDREWARRARRAGNNSDEPVDAPPGDPDP